MREKNCLEIPKAKHHYPEENFHVGDTVRIFRDFIGPEEAGWKAPKYYFEQSNDITTSRGVKSLIGIYGKVTTVKGHTRKAFINDRDVIDHFESCVVAIDDNADTNRGFFFIELPSFFLSKVSPAREELEKRIIERAKHPLMNPEPEDGKNCLLSALAISEGFNEGKTRYYKIDMCTVYVEGTLFKVRQYFELEPFEKNNDRFNIEVTILDENDKKIETICEFTSDYLSEAEDYIVLAVEKWFSNGIKRGLDEMDRMKARIKEMVTEMAEEHRADHNSEFIKMLEKSKNAIKASKAINHKAKKYCTNPYCEYETMKTFNHCPICGTKLAEYHHN